MQFSENTLNCGVLKHNSRGKMEKVNPGKPATAFDVDNIFESFAILEKLHLLDPWNRRLCGIIL